jgi:TRAP-type C4-dicarboxylate transport system substrate-binding protein
MTIRFGAAGVLAASLALSLVAGCHASAGGRGADKAGGLRAPRVLNLGSNDLFTDPDTPNVEYFAAQVRALSGGSLRVHVILQAAGDAVPDTEERIARMVRGGKLDLGWIGARAWDELGVTSLQALQAPFLITSYPLLDRVATGPLARRMLAGLARQHVIGLALVPELLRHPVGFRHPLSSLADFEGARIRTLPSRAGDALLRALGAIPVHESNVAFATDRRSDGEETSFGRVPVGADVTPNVTFFPKALTLFIGERSYARLSPEQRRILRAAAARTLRHATAYPVSAALAFEGVLTRQYCRTPGHVSLAGTKELAGLVRAARPVYAELERNAGTRVLIAEIRALKRSLPRPPPIVVPVACLASRRAPTSPRPALSPSSLNGTYRWVLTDAGARAFGAPADDPGNEYPKLTTVVLRNGRARILRSPSPSSGTYTVIGTRIVFNWSVLGYPLAFTFARAHDGSLRLTAVQPMDPGDQWVWSGAPWRRIGPAIGAVP